jgi:23S rRNA pseudouridine955/2504/2580 synthase
MKTVKFKDLILFEDEDYILINKPSDISSLDERASNAANINSLAKAYWPDAQVCHRLDKETSGILAIAKNSEAYRNLAMQFEHREVTKTYHAVIDGIHEFKEFRVNQPIFSISGGGLVKIDKEKGKPAETFFTTMRVFNKHSLIECKPVTGRMHQIRVHLSYIKAPITGDLQYGGNYVYLSEIKKKFNLKMETEELPIIKRVALHAYSLKFAGLKGDLLDITAPYPKDFAVLIKQLERYS